MAEIELGQALHDRLRARERRGRVAGREDERELVAAKAEGLAAGPEPRADLREDAIAGRVAEAVVDPLEVVDVEEAQRQRRPTLARTIELVANSLVEVPVIAEPGERVGERKSHRPIDLVV